MYIESITKNFDPSVACNVGTDAAIILANIEIWQHHAKINGLNVYDGKNWIYNKVESFQKQFYYLTEKQISLCLKKLEENGYLSVGCYNENVFDRTKWYTSERLNKSVFEPVKLNIARKNTDDKKLIEINKPIENQDALYFYIAKSYHETFISKKGQTRTLLNASYNDWIKTVRLLITTDEVTVPQLIAIKLYLQDGVNGVAGVDTFWINTISSIHALRKKNKDEVYYFDMIRDHVQKWLKIKANEIRVYKAEEKLKKHIENLNDNTGST